MREKHLKDGLHNSFLVNRWLVKPSTFAGRLSENWSSAKCFLD